jgi:FkbM family methyltransferase
MRSAAIDTGFAVAERLERVGLGPVTHRVRRLVARVGADHHEVDVDGILVGGSLASHGSYLRSLSGPAGHLYELELIRDAVEPGMTVVDCGSHLGLHALVAAREAGPDGTVIAVEAAAPTAAALRAIVAANGFEDRVEVVEAAAVAEPGPVEIHLHPYLDRAGLADEASDAERVVEVPGVRLDDVLGEREFDVAKIDVEGGEVGAYAGLEEALSRSPEATLFLECHPERLYALGEDPVAWVEGLAAERPLELIDDWSRSVTPLRERAEIEAIVAARTENFQMRSVAA